MLHERPYPLPNGYDYRDSYYGPAPSQQGGFMKSVDLVNDDLGQSFKSMGLDGPKAEDACTLFLGDLSVYCSEKDIRKLFRPFGVIEAIRVKRGTSNKTNLSYGFIKFSTRESADQALRQLNGVMFLGRAIRSVDLSLFLI